MPTSPAAAAGLLAVSADLTALETLLANASQRLFTAFSQASQLVNHPQDNPRCEAQPALRQALADAAVALQFEDIAQQKIAHVQARLRVMATTWPEEATPCLGLLPTCGLVVPPRPVEQADVHAGSIDFF